MKRRGRERTKDALQELLREISGFQTFLNGAGPNEDAAVMTMSKRQNELGPSGARCSEKASDRKVGKVE